MTPYPSPRNRDGQQVVVSGGVSYSDHQEVRDLVLAMKQDIMYLKEAIDRFDKCFQAADKEWDTVAELGLQRILALEKESERRAGEAIGITRSAAFISAVFTLIGMFLAIGISLVVK